MRVRTPKLILPLLAVLTVIPAPTQQQATSNGTTDSRAASLSKSSALIGKYVKLPLSFEANQGQANSHVRFLSRGEGFSLFLTDREAVLALQKSSISEGPSKGHSMTGALPSGKPELIKTDVVRMQLSGASAALRVTGSEQLPGKTNYLIGSDPGQWHSDVPTFRKVKYTGVFPGVDLVYHGNQRQLEYDFVVAPQVDTRQIRLRFAGAKKLKLDPSGDLQVIAKNGEIAFRKPVIYQDADGERQPVEERFVLLAKNEAGFEIGAYDHSQVLVIDPTVVYSTDFGPSVESFGIAADSKGNAYVVGNTDVTDFPYTPGAYQSTLGIAGEAAYITKFNSSGTELIYATYLGAGNKSTSAAGIAVDSSGDAYVTGFTNSASFPVTSGAYQTTFYGSPSVFGSAYVTKLNTMGTGLVYSTFLSGPPITSGPFTGYTNSSAVGIAVDATGRAYVTGITLTGGFPVTTGAFDFQGTSYSGSFVSKLSADGSTLVYSAFIGDDQTTSICIDKNDDAYVAGSTIDVDFPVTSGAIQTTNNGNEEYVNATIAELSASGSALVYATYLGGSGPAPGDAANGIAVDSSGEAYVTGQATSTDFPVTTGVFQTVNNGAADGTANAFVTKLNAS